VRQTPRGPTSLRGGKRRRSREKNSNKKKKRKNQITNKSCSSNIPTIKGRSRLRSRETNNTGEIYIGGKELRRASVRRGQKEKEKDDLGHAGIRDHREGEGRVLIKKKRKGGVGIEVETGTGGDQRREEKRKSPTLEITPGGGGILQPRGVLLKKARRRKKGKGPARAF